MIDPTSSTSLATSEQQQCGKVSSQHRACSQDDGCKLLRGAKDTNNHEQDSYQYQMKGIERPQAKHIDSLAFSTSIHAAMVCTNRTETRGNQRGGNKLLAASLLLPSNALDLVRNSHEQIHLFCEFFLNKFSKSLELFRKHGVGFTCAARSQGLGRGFILPSAMAWSGLGGLSSMSLIPGMGCPCQTALHTQD